MQLTLGTVVVVAIVVVLVVVVIIVVTVMVHADCISVSITGVARLFVQSQPPRAGQEATAVRCRAIPVPHPSLTGLHSAGYV